MNRPNQHDNRGAFERGERAEDRFKRCAEKDGWIVEKTGSHEDINDHVDFVIKRPEIDGYRCMVDVKALGAEHKYSEGKVWLEIRNVQGNAGWVYGKADFIAFERDKGFLMVGRPELQQWVNENVEKRYVTDKQKATMCIYQRAGRKDMITLVPDHHLLAIAQRTGGLLRD